MVGDDIFTCQNAIPHNMSMSSCNSRMGWVAALQAKHPSLSPPWLSWFCFRRKLTQNLLRDHDTQFGGEDVPAFHSAISQNVYIVNGPNETSHLLFVYVRILLLIGNGWFSVT